MIDKLKLWLFSILYACLPFLRWVRPRREAVPSLRLRVPFMIWRTYCEPVPLISWTSYQDGGIGQMRWCFKWLCLYVFKERVEIPGSGRSNPDKSGMVEYDYHDVVIFRCEIKTLSIGAPWYAASKSTADPRRTRHLWKPKATQ